MTAHALFSPSSAHRWMTCPGSLVLSEGERDTGNSASAEGTFLHDCMQKHLEKGVPLSEFNLNEEQLSILTECARHVSSIDRIFEAYEIKVSFGKQVGQLDEEAFGTSDVVLVYQQEEETICRIIDYKFGRNAVNPKENTQGYLYMLGMMSYLQDLGFEIDIFEFEILQPRTSGGLSNGVYTVVADALNGWADKAREACKNVEKAYADHKVIPIKAWNENYLNATDAGCEYCRAAHKCPALKKMMDETVGTGALSDSQIADFFDNVEEDDLADRLAKVPMLKRYIEALETEAMARALEGNIPEGFRLIEGRQGNRRWSDKQTVIAEMKSLGMSEYDFMQTDLKSPAQMEKALITAGNSRDEARDIIANLVDRNPPKPSLVPEYKAKGGTPWQGDFVENMFERIE